MSYKIFGYQAWKREQISSLKRICGNFSIVYLFLPMALIELVLSIGLMIFLIPFLFSRGLHRFFIKILVLYKKSTDLKLIEEAAKEELPFPPGITAETISGIFVKDEEKFLADFVSKLSPFIFGVLTTLVTLYFTDKI
jgi:hypothetical protein